MLIAVALAAELLATGAAALPAAAVTPTARILTVNSLAAGYGDCAGAGACSLQDAVTIANGDRFEGDTTQFTIQFADSLSAPGAPARIPLVRGVVIADAGLVLDGGSDVVLVPDPSDPLSASEPAIFVAADDVRISGVEITGFSAIRPIPYTTDTAPGTGIVAACGVTGLTVSRSPIHGNAENLKLATACSPTPANHGQLPPRVTGAGAAGADVLTPLAVDGSAGEAAVYTVEVFRCTTSEPPEGTAYAGNAEHVPAGRSVLVPLEVPVAPGDRFSATVTDEASHETSTFSSCSDAGAGVGHSPSVPGGYGPYGPYGPYEGFGPFGPYGPFTPSHRS